MLIRGCANGGMSEDFEAFQSVSYTIAMPTGWRLCYYKTQTGMSVLRTLCTQAGSLCYSYIIPH